MKLAISGKGGVGKSTVAAALALLLARSGSRVLAVDADPDANLAAALGVSAEERRRIVPISRQVALVEERTGAKVKQYGQMFKLNPQVSDIADSYATVHKGVALIVLGAIVKGGGGCACPESVLVKALVADLVLHRNEALVMDMEAGIEHLGRGTAQGVDAMLVVVEPGQRAVDCAMSVVKLCKDLKIKKIYAVANKITCPGDEQFVRNSLGDLHLLACVPYAESIRRSDMEGKSVLEGLDLKTTALFEDILEQVKT